MKTQTIFASLIFLAATITGFAQTNSFDHEIAPWHKKAVMTCNMLKAPNFDVAQISKNVSELESELKIISVKYLYNPPQEYAKDANWKSYFMSLNEYVAVIKERIENKQFTQASIYFPYFCMTFGKMHRINGTTNLTDVMFSWRMELKNTSDMLNAGNVAGANQNINTVEGIYQKVIAMKAKKNDSILNELFTPLDEAYTAWLKELIEGNKEAMNASKNTFINVFAKPYMATL